MLKSIDKEAAFAAIAEDLELPLVLLSNPDPRVRLAQVEKINAVLAATNLTFRDLAERVVTPRPAAVQPSAAVPPPMPIPTLRPASEIVVEKLVEAAAPLRPILDTTVLTNEQLAAYGYRSRGSCFGYEGTPIPGSDAPKPTDQ